MSKVATRYLEVDPWCIVEKGFHPERSLVSESIFSVGNEFMGVRGMFDEGYGGDSLVGSYFNGVFEYRDLPGKPSFLGPISRTHFMVNAVNWLHSPIVFDGERLDLARSRVSDFERVLDFRTGVYRRSFVWHAESGKRLRLGFERLTSMNDPNLGVQRLELESLDGGGLVEIEAGLDFTVPHAAVGHCLWHEVRVEADRELAAVLCRLPESGHRVCSTMRLASSGKAEVKPMGRDRFAGYRVAVRLAENLPAILDRIVVNTVERQAGIADDAVWAAGLAAARERGAVGYEQARGRQLDWWGRFWEQVGVGIDGDPENEQGVRFGIFQLTQTYSGVDPSLNVAAKGLTGEDYWGHAWWDTETYCLPFYLFTNPKAAKNLLGYRHLTLPNAVRRSAADDCVGARYPMCSIDGYEACPAWQHGDLEIHVSAAVGYGIWHYVRVTGDREFLHGPGIEMLLEICRFYASRGGWGQQTGKFGFYGVMGADEFHMMVDNNCYTNVMAKKCFEWTLQTVAEMRQAALPGLEAALAKAEVDESTLRDWENMALNMHVPLDEESGIYEQHSGFFNYPHTNVAKIPPEDYPLYGHWSYFRIFRTDMTKQPDVLLLHFFFSGEFSDQSKLVNYRYYEPRCSHESSLSPGIHSILAAELGMHEKAFEYWGHAARLDLDDYNRNTGAGLHTTSMAAAWMNLVYGFGGMRSDRECLVFRPSMPASWNRFSFKIRYRDSAVKVVVDRAQASFELIEGDEVEAEVFGEKILVTAAGVSRPMPKERVA